jgi:hypothetical protein
LSDYLKDAMFKGWYDGNPMYARRGLRQFKPYEEAKSV